MSLSEDTPVICYCFHAVFIVTAQRFINLKASSSRTYIYTRVHVCTQMNTLSLSLPFYPLLFIYRILPRAIRPTLRIHIARH
jgi:hypothetical protein